MTTIDAQVVGDQVVLPRGDWDQLISPVRNLEQVQIQSSEDDLPALGLTILAQEGRAFDWLKDDDDLCSLDDVKLRQCT